MKDLRKKLSSLDKKSKELNEILQDNYSVILLRDDYDYLNNIQETLDNLEAQITDYQEFKKWISKK